MVQPNSNNRQKGMLLGLGLDSRDGHTRVTRGDNFVLTGGSEETHEKMVETTVKFNEKLDAKRKRIEDLSKNEFIDMISEASGGMDS